MTDLQSKHKVIHTFSDETKGEFLLCLPIGKEYALSVSKESYLFHSEHFSIPDTLSVYESHHIDIALQTIRKDENIVLKNVFFDTDKFVLKPESFIELDKLTHLLQENPDLDISISGHTDNSGTVEHNQKLSEKRAGAVYEYLMEKEIDSKRLLYIGYGSSQPIADNETASGRSENRRTEFKVIRF